MTARTLADFTVAELDRPALDYVWRNMRPHDRQEVMLQGLTDANYAGHVMSHKLKFSTSLDGVPLAIYGAIEGSHVFWLYWISTNELRRHLRLFTECARAFIDWLRLKFFGKRCLVLVWSKHTQSIGWLVDLGFLPVEAIMRGHQLFLIMEKKR